MISATINPVPPTNVSMIVQVFNVVFSSSPISDLTSQNPESLKCEQTVAPPATAATTHARYIGDKDAISATAALCEAAAYYKEKGMTLWDAMVAMYEKYGYYKDTVKSIGLKGIEGLAKIQEIMENFRKNPPKALGGYEVTSVRDYKKNTITEVATGEVKETGLPESNVLYYDMNDGAWLCIRPSGTEPKIKFYYGVKGTSLDDAEAKSKAVGDELMGMVDKMM